MAALVGQHPDLDLGRGGHLDRRRAERLRITPIATVDRRDLAVVRPKHVPAFEWFDGWAGTDGRDRLEPTLLRSAGLGRAGATWGLGQMGNVSSVNTAARRECGGTSSAS